MHRQRNARYSRWTWAALAAVLLLAAAIRLWQPERAPAGLNADEALNAWNAWSLLHTGRDQHGVGWPILDSRGFGQGMTTLYLYLLVPVLGLFGFSTAAIRLLPAITGLATIALAYYIGARLFDRTIGIAGATILAFSPWHIQQSRWGHQAALFPLGVAVIVAALLWAGLPLSGLRRPSPARAAVAGGLAGVFMYGYLAIRLWLPLFLLALGVALWPEWRQSLRAREGRMATLFFGVGAAVIAAPLLLGTIHDPLLRKRAVVTWVWGPTDPLPVRIEKTLARYPDHFGLDFLFREGDVYPAMSPPAGHGLFLWVTLPLMVIGAVWVLRQMRDSRSRLVAALVLTYPAADLASAHPSSHALRSLPGLLALSILAAIGFAALIRSFSKAARPLGAAAALLVIAAGAAESSWFLRDYFQRLDRDAVKFLSFSADLVAMTKWMKPRLNQYDAIFVTGNAISHPYIYTLVALQYSPEQWFRDAKEFRDGPLPNGWFRDEEICLRFGRMNFFFPGVFPSELQRMASDATPQRMLFVLRPRELAWLRLPPPVFTIRDPDGREVLWAVEATL